MDKEIKEHIKSQIERDNLILFIGAGIPANLGLPNWENLIKKISKDLGYDDNVFMKHGDYLSLAEFYRIKKGHIGELRDWMSGKWEQYYERVKTSAIYDSIIELNCKIIYTTNYDHSLETAFFGKGIEYKRIVDVSDLTNIPLGTTQIIKFHGDTIKEDSIVLTEEDYFKRLNFESPLDIKLRADMLGKSILFIGYSLSDINMRLLIYKLDQLWRTTNNAELRPKSYIFLTSPNPVQEAILNHRGVIPIIGTKPDPDESLENFLIDLL